jgi:hypothetical protein
MLIIQGPESRVSRRRWRSKLLLHHGLFSSAPRGGRVDQHDLDVVNTGLSVLALPRLQVIIIEVVVYCLLYT